MRDVILTLDNLAHYCDEEGDCMLWRNGCNSAGSPAANIGGKQWLVRRYIATLLGMDIDGLCVSAACGNARCVSPTCLRLRTRSQTSASAYERGNRGSVGEYIARRNAAVALGWAKLTPEQVIEIRSAPADVSHKTLALRYGMSRNGIINIRLGRSWRNAAPAASVFSRGAL